MVLHQRFTTETNDDGLELLKVLLPSWKNYGFSFPLNLPLLQENIGIAFLKTGQKVK